MMMTPKPKFTILMICTTSVLNTSSLEVILMNFRAYVQFHSDSSSSTRIRVIHLDRPTGLFHSDVRMFHSEDNLHSDDHIFTQKVISLLDRQVFIPTVTISL